MSTALVNGGGVAAAVLAVIVGIALHRKAVASVARNWRGGHVSWAKLWLGSILGAVVCVVALAALLVALGLSNSDFMVLLMHDWQQPVGAGLWLAALVIGAGGAPLAAMLSSKSSSSARLEG